MELSTSITGLSVLTIKDEKVTVNKITSIYHKTNTSEMMRWMGNENLSIWQGKEKSFSWIGNQQSNAADPRLKRDITKAVI